MKRAVMLCDERNRAILSETISIMESVWNDEGYEVSIFFVSENESPDIYMNELVRLKEDFVVTFAMAGFSWRGLMEQVRFNTLPAMQIHILLGSLPQYDFFLHDCHNMRPPEFQIAVQIVVVCCYCQLPELF